MNPMLKQQVELFKKRWLAPYAGVDINSDPALAAKLEGAVEAFKKRFLENATWLGRNLTEKEKEEIKTACAIAVEQKPKTTNTNPLKVAFLSGPKARKHKARDPEFQAIVEALKEQFLANEGKKKLKRQQKEANKLK